MPTPSPRVESKRSRAPAPPASHTIQPRQCAGAVSPHPHTAAVEPRLAPSRAMRPWWAARRRRASRPAAG
ncbi:hypothetical protein AOA12_20880 [Microbacterium sp. No. 7]|nr:hypothetical protein AOA12_20880 [Microbacterium sp. No. 7]